MTLHFTPMGMAIIKTSANNKRWQGYGESETLGNITGTTAVEYGVAVLQKLRIQLPHDPATPPLGINPAEPKAGT